MFHENPYAAASIHGEYASWRDIKGLQMEGRVTSVKGFMNVAQAVKTYTGKFPFSKDFFSDPAGVVGNVGKSLSRAAAHAFRPVKIYYLDNSLGFGVRWKMELEDGSPLGEAERA
jgi:uncharacterized protein YhbP (UPF0306 family)